MTFKNIFIQDIKWHMVFLFFVFLPLFFVFTSNVQAKILYQTGFEGDVILGIPKTINGQWWQTYEEGPSTIGQMPGLDHNMVAFLIDSSDIGSLSELKNYIVSEIQTVKGINNKNTNAWLMKNLKHYNSGPPNYTAQRISLNVQSGDNFPDSLEEIYIQYDMKFIPEFNESMTKNSWNLIWEVFVDGNTNKLSIFRLSEDDPLRWKLEPHSDVVMLNETDIVPLNRWFNIGIYFKHSLYNDGMITIFVDNKKIFDYRGSTADSGGVHAMNFLKSYCNVKNVGHWVDNLEIHDSINVEIKTLGDPPNLRIIP
jgi:hypothetical protein